MSPNSASPSAAPSPTPSSSPPPPSTTSELARLTNILTQTETELQSVESSILSLEASYIRDTWAEGNAVRGWDDYVRRLERRMGRETNVGGDGESSGARQRKVRASDKMFSLSSSTGGAGNTGNVALKKGGRKKGRSSTR